MCGIAGQYCYDKGIVERDLILKMRDSMVHRGPDGAGIWINRNQSLALAHRRLSIIDLSRLASQPMSDYEGRWHIVFNGEIYNHVEIRDELSKVAKIQWKTSHSDTEVLLYAFRQWGIKCLDKLVGMFAFAIWDELEQKLWLVRDRVGVKPLYFSIYDGKISFASEIKAILCDKKIRLEVDERALFHYLTFLTSPSPNTMFKGINKLPAASYICIDKNNSFEIKKYWDPLSGNGDKTLSEVEYSELLFSELQRSVKYRKISDVPVGVFLSGGVDSSTNAKLFSNQESSVKTFCVGYEGEYDSCRNETQYARMMSNHIGADHFEKILSCSELVDFIPELIYYQDEPIGDPVCFPVYAVAKLAKKNGVTVCQVGEGADELFCGYPLWNTLLKIQQANNLPLPEFVKSFMRSILPPLLGKDSWQAEAIKRCVTGRSVFWGGAEAFTSLQKYNLLSSRLKREFKDVSSWEIIEPYWQKYNTMVETPQPLQWMTYLDLNLRLPELLLMRVDKMTMAVGLEARVPFLDHRIVELALQIPDKLKINHGQLKYILKSTVNDILPKEIINRPKQGFGVPIYEWLDEKLGEVIRSELISFCKETDFFDLEMVNKCLERPQRQQLWFLYNFVAWFRKHIK